MPEVSRVQGQHRAPPAVPWPEGDLKWVQGDIRVPHPGPGWGPQGRARQVGEEKQMIKELAGQIASLQAEEAGLWQENAELDSEIWQLRQRLRMLPGVCVDYLTQLQEKWREKEACCSELERKLATSSGQVTSTQQIRSVYKQMAKALRQHLEENPPYHWKKILFVEYRAQGSWMAAVGMWRKLKELRDDKQHHRQALQVQGDPRPYPPGPDAPTAPPATPRSPEVEDPGHWDPSKEEGLPIRAQGSGVTCRDDSAPSAQV
ncbi:cTAGE family member 2 [Camelus dromedarius]|uniref:CTAGE family member 2 n=1 Tax=Camelus dromedarius TaxID=9838 RepID=A0A5N4DGV4_CAMDR|nr:cTAGE family member 2 [Camelus dromedarius]